MLGIGRRGIEAGVRSSLLEIIGSVMSSLGTRCGLRLACVVWRANVLDDGRKSLTEKTIAWIVSTGLRQ